MLLLFPVSLMAQATDFGIWVNTTNFKSTTETDPDLPGSRFDIDFDQKMGYGLTYNRYFSQNFSTEFGLAQIRSDANATFVSTVPPINQTFRLGEFKAKVWSAVVQWHFVPRGFIDPYLGGGVAYFQGAQLRIPEDAIVDEPGDTVKFDNKTKFTMNAGINVGVTKGLTVALDARYTPYEAVEENSPQADSVTLDPLTISLGLRFRR